MMTHSSEPKSFIRGVNLGGFFVFERFITPYFFALTDCHLKGDFRFYPEQVDAPPTTSPIYKAMDTEECKPILPYPVDEWTLTGAFDDKDMAKRYLEIHYDNFITRKDIKFLKQNGVSHVRVPLGHWITGNIAEDEPFVDGGWPYFKRLVGWCREEGIQIWPDIHTAPGSQNGFDNSGHALAIPTCHGWDMDDMHAPEYNSTLLGAQMGLNGVKSGEVVLSKNVQRTLDIVDEITAAIASNNMTDVVTGFGVLNEPFANCDMNVITKFDNLALDIVRKNMGESTSIYIGDVFNSTKFNDGFWTEPKYKGTYLDSHYYHVFDERPRHLSPRQHIALVCQKNHKDTIGCCYEDQANKTIPSNGISRIIGEWSASPDTLVCDKLDDVMAAIAKTGIAAEFDRQLSPVRREFLRNFVEAQMVSYEAVDSGVSSGWFYWTFHMEGGAFAEWDFKRGLSEGWIPPIPPANVASVDLYGSCYDIVLQTNDSSAILHEFPDPTSLDTHNWQGFPIDDDVVVSHGQNLVKDADGDWYNPSSVTISDHKVQVTVQEKPATKYLNKNSAWLLMFLVVGAAFLLKKRSKKSHDGYTEIDKGTDGGVLEIST